MVVDLDSGAAASAIRSAILQRSKRAGAKRIIFSRPMLDVDLARP